MIKKFFMDDLMCQALLQFWYRRFRLGQKSVENNLRSGRTEINADRAIKENLGLKVRDLESL